MLKIKYQKSLKGTSIKITWGIYGLGVCSKSLTLAEQVVGGVQDNLT